jgi:membrane peptidoglycan carboxypeptidase
LVVLSASPSAEQPARKRAGTLYVALTVAAEPEFPPCQEKKRRRARRRRIGVIVGVVCAVLFPMAAGVIYGAFETIPLPGQVRTDQASVLYYADGVTELARVGVENRTDVPLTQVPEEVQRAVLAAEDRDFFDHHGLSVIGIGRALVSNATGGSTQGASTITQQYVKNAFLTPDRTMDRKVRELVLAVKTERRYSKEEILEFYLNTVYFGRGAYGIDAAAQTYFGVPVRKLKAEQAAVLAAVIKSPAGYDPANDPAAANARWRYVLDSMVAEGWLDEDRARSAKFPKVHPPGARSIRGPNGYVVARVERELARHGISEQKLRTGGLRIVTTLDRAAQDAAVATMRAGFTQQPPTNRGALVAVQPGTGQIRAYYGGDKGYGFLDYAEGSYPAASTFKAYVLAEALRSGVDYRDSWDGSSPLTLPGRGGTPLSNRDGLSCPDCTLERSMVLSLNTPFYALAYELGPHRVAELAHRAGIRRVDRGRRTLVDLPGELTPGRTRADIALGRYRVTPLDQAVGFATFAARGVHADPYLVQRAEQKGRLIYAGRQRTTRVLERADSDALTHVLGGVVNHLGGLAGGRPAAGKTGTQQYRSTKENSDAWMVGYTPQLAVSVWLGHDRPASLRDRAGKPIQGDQLPAALWGKFLDRALIGVPHGALSPGWAPPDGRRSFDVQGNTAPPRWKPSRAATNR